MSLSAPTDPGARPDDDGPRPAPVDGTVGETGGNPWGWERARRFVVHRILHLSDTPHRIAFGVGLGFFVAATPTIGFQMIIYIAIAAVVGANKLSGIGPVWLSNPVTAVPLYYGNWKLGKLLLTGSFGDNGEGRQVIEAVMGNGDRPVDFWERMFDAEFWHQAVDALFSIGAELWLGSVVVGTVFGAGAYWLTYRGVVAYRAHKEAEEAAEGGDESEPKSEFDGAGNGET